MLKYWTATSLMALALLVGFVDQGVKAQGVLQPRLSIVQNPGIPVVGPPILPYPWIPSDPQKPSNPKNPGGQQITPYPLTPIRPPYQIPLKLDEPQILPYPRPPPGPPQQKPSTPGKPSEPQRPSTPWTPPGPPQQKPSTPGKPSEPQRPSTPWIPPGPPQQKPSTPGKPSEPQRPSRPWIPPGPPQQKPSTPGKPGDPQKPSIPTKPSRPPYQNPSIPLKRDEPQIQPYPWSPPGPPQQGPWKPGDPQKPSTPWIPPGHPQKPSNPPNPPKYSKNLPQYSPRASPPAQQVSKTPYNPSQGGTHQTGVTKTPYRDRCEVAEKSRIPCGQPEISSSACLEIGGCFDGYSCYFGKAVTVQCTKDGHFIVVVAKDTTLPHLDLNTISMYGEGPTCTYTDSNSEFAIYYFDVTQCGTAAIETEPGIITYENMMRSYFDVQFGDGGQITRDTSYELFFQCRYTATSVNSLVIELLPSDEPLPVASIGPVRVLMQLAKGRCTAKGCNEVEAAYTSFYTEDEYPVEKILREPVYVQVEILERTDPSVILTLDRCWTTISPYPHTFPQWDILINGCPNPVDPYTSELVTVPSDFEYPGHYRRFFFKMFAFIDSISLEPMQQQVYLHCSTSLCFTGQGRVCESLCYRKFKKREAKTTEKGEEKKIVITAGPVTISAPKI